MTRFGIGRRTQLYADAASAVCPSLQGRTVSPHVFRHTTALHLIEAGNDIFLVRDWLGHADIATTSLYIEISIERKRAALEKVPPPTKAAVPELPMWKKPDIINFLNRLSRKQDYVANNAENGKFSPGAFLGQSQTLSLSKGRPKQSPRPAIPPAPLSLVSRSRRRSRRPLPCGPWFSVDAKSLAPSGFLSQQLSRLEPAFCETAVILLRMLKDSCRSAARV